MNRVLFKRRLDTLLKPHLCRYLSSSEAATALRPFYRAVHPDLFGQHPSEQAVNEESLKKLHEYLNIIQVHGTVRRIDISFFARAPHEAPDLTVFRQYHISLSSQDIRTAVTEILKSCDLPMDYVNSVPTKTYSLAKFPRPIKWDHTYYTETGEPNPENVGTFKTELSLHNWLRLNIERAEKYHVSNEPIKDEIDKICDDLKTQMGLADIRWESLWDYRHFRGCLRSFDRLYKQHSIDMNQLLRHRYLVFSHESGVNLHGEIILSSEDVPTSWLRLLKSALAYDVVLDRLPLMEGSLSKLLKNIQIVRRKRIQTMMAEEYELLLNKLLNAFARNQDEINAKLDKESLSDLELVVEGESGPLALSSTGQILIPASCPSSVVIDFLVQNKDKARTLLNSNRQVATKERSLITLCRYELELSGLARDESVSPQQMSMCCQRLLDENSVHFMLRAARLYISHYYSVMQNGEMCIPWDWKGGS